MNYIFDNLIISPGQSTGISLLSLHPSSGSGSKMLTLDNYQQGTLFLQFLSQMTDSDCSWLSGVVIMMIMMMIMMMIIMMLMTLIAAGGVDLALVRQQRLLPHRALRVRGPHRRAPRW